MAKTDEEVDLTSDEALERATKAIETGPLAQIGIRIQTNEEMRIRMAQRLIDATTVDDILSENATSGWEKHEGRSVLIRDAAYAPSTKKGGLGFYTIVSAVDVNTDEPLILTSGSENVVLQVAKLVKVGGLDVPVKLVSNDTSDGNTVHRLVKGDAGDKVPY